MIITRATITRAGELLTVTVESGDEAHTITHSALDWLDLSVCRRKLEQVELENKQLRDFAKLDEGIIKDLHDEVADLKKLVDSNAEAYQSLLNRYDRLHQSYVDRNDVLPDINIA